MHDIWKDMFVTGLPLAEKISGRLSSMHFWWSAQAFRKTRTRSAQSIRPGCLADALEYRAERIIGEDNSVLGGIIGATSLLVTNYLVVRFLYDHRKIDQFVEGRADVLVEGGKVRTQRLKKELITMAQLEAAARKQGFESLSEVDQCVLEPGGTLTFVAKKPATEDVRHQELLPSWNASRRKLPSCGARSLLHALDSVQKETCRCSAIPAAPMSTPPIQKNFFLVSSVIEQITSPIPKALLRHRIGRLG